MHDVDYQPLEADREIRHEIAHDYGGMSSGEPLPEHTDSDGRVWVTCTCGKKFPLNPQPAEQMPGDLGNARALSEFLDAHGPAQVTAALNAVYADAQSALDDQSAQDDDLVAAQVAAAGEED